MVKEAAPSDAMFFYLLAGLVGGALGGALAALGISADTTGLKLIGFVLAGIGTVLLTIWTIAVGVMLGLRAHSRAA